jgi:hypothetical protein
MAAAATVEAFLSDSGAVWRRVAHAEWGLTIDAADRPLDVGIAIRGGLLRAQAEALPPDRLDGHELLHRNRFLSLVRFAHTSAGAVYVQGELPVEGLTPQTLDRLLGALLQAASDVRYAATPRRAD